jgi:hypothetical protein
MADVLRIKRRAVGGAAGPPAALAAAEIAYNEQDDTLYYGKGNSAGAATSIVPIAGTGSYLPRITISDTAPVTPAVGDLWFDSVGSNLYIRFNDGTSTQWVPVIAR